MFTEQPFYGNYFTLDSHINTVISHWLVTYSSQRSTLPTFFWGGCLSSLFDPITLILVYYLFERSLPPTFCEGRCIIFAFWWFSTSFADDKDSPLNKTKIFPILRRKKREQLLQKRKNCPRKTKVQLPLRLRRRRKEKKKEQQ